MSVLSFRPKSHTEIADREEVVGVVYFLENFTGNYQQMQIATYSFGINAVMPQSRIQIWILRMLGIAHTYLFIRSVNGSVNASADSGTVQIVSERSEGLKR